MVCMQFSFPSDHSGQKKASDSLTYLSAWMENNINVFYLYVFVADV